MKTRKLPSYVKRYELAHGCAAEIDTARARPFGCAYRDRGNGAVVGSAVRRTVAEVLAELSRQVQEAADKWEL
jgi:hypothetical protein